MGESKRTRAYIRAIARLVSFSFYDSGPSGLDGIRGAVIFFWADELRIRSSLIAGAWARAKSPTHRCGTSGDSARNSFRHLR